ncbi:MAG: ABC transporter substrate-binding protein [Trueperaceae bacterium]|nr:MAG: ABC transporter substrate-binding protein [Trueperaceae bacterium]
MARSQLTVLQAHVAIGDPHVSSDDKNRLSILSAIFEPLVRRAPRGMYSPCLAENWSTSEDARTWTFALRQNAAFHHGEPLEADDVVASLCRVRDQAIGGELGTQGVYQSYLEGSIIEALDVATVRLVTPVPMADLLDLLVELPILPGGDLAQGLIGTGPYRLIDAGEAEVMTEAFDRYWGGKPVVQRLFWRGEPDPSERVRALLAAEADLISAVPLDLHRKVEDASGVDLVSAASSVCSTFMCNLNTGPCADRRVRQALNYALDVPAIVETVMVGSAELLTGPFTQLHLGFDPDVPAYPFDPALAHKLLAEAGYRDGITLTFDIPSVLPDEAPRLARQMADQYGEVGIELEVIEHTDRPAYAEMVRAKEMHDACCFDSSPLSTYRLLREKFHGGVRGPWWLGYRNAEVDALIDKAQATALSAKRQRLYQRIHRLIRDDAPWVFLYSPKLYWGIGPRAHGWQPRVDGLIGVS